MTKRHVGVSLGLLLLLGAAWAGAGEPVLPFHATLQATDDCESLPNPGQCLGFDDWSAECLARGYNQAFQAVRAGHATHLGHVTSFERGCLEFGATGVARSNVQLTVYARNGDDTLTFYANALFDFAGWSAPLNPPPATGTFTITGGTGRYAGVRGSGTLGNVFGEGNPGWIIYLDGSLRTRQGRR
ncbi:MAG TPA: hypothetical protein VGB87_18945 [Vicinamibacteria bacterium]